MLSADVQETLQRDEEDDEESSDEEEDEDDLSDGELAALGKLPTRNPAKRMTGLGNRPLNKIYDYVMNDDDAPRCVKAVAHLVCEYNGF